MNAVAAVRSARRRRERAIAAAGLVLCLVLLGANHRPIVNALLPLYTLAIELWGPSLTLHQLRLARNGADTAVQATLSISEPVRLRDGQWFRPDSRGRVTASVSSAKALLPVACLMACVLLLPWAERRELLARLLLVPPAVLAILALDLPAVLVGIVWDLAAEHLAGLRSSGIQALGQFMESGGRWVLGISAGVLIAAAARWWADGAA